MTYVESADLMNDTTFRGRIKVAGLEFATYVLNEPPSTDGHTSRYRWAQQMSQQPDMVAGQLQPMVVMDSNVQSAGAGIDDATLQTAVETVIKTFV